MEIPKPRKYKGIQFKKKNNLSKLLKQNSLKNKLHNNKKSILFNKHH